MKNSFLLILISVFISNLSYSQKQYFIGDWVELYDEWTYETTSGIKDISFDEAQRIKIDKDSIYLIKNNKILKKSNYQLIKNNNLLGISYLKSEIIELSFYNGGLETPGRGSCNEWTHYIRLMDDLGNKSTDFKFLKELLILNQDIRQDVTYLYYKTNGVLVFENKTFYGYIETLNKDKIITSTYYNSREEIIFKVKYSSNEKTSKGLWEYYDNSSIINNKEDDVFNKVVKTIERKKIDLYGHFFLINKKDFFWEISWKDSKTQKLRYISINANSGKIIQNTEKKLPDL